MNEMLETYGELLEQLKKLTPEQLKQRVQALEGTSDDSIPVVCKPVISIGTVRELFEVASEDGSRIEDHQYVRDARDGKHHSDAVVLHMDASGYEDDTRWRERRILLKAVKKIAERESGTVPDRIARAALDEIAVMAEKKKKKKKECV